jgi:CRP-like cAMP-binding protein
LDTEIGKKRRAIAVARCLLPYARQIQEGHVLSCLDQVQPEKRLLAALPHEMLALIQGDLRQISLPQGKAIYEPGDQIDEIYCPQSGMISLLIFGRDGSAIEAATIGREGAVGLHSALGKRLSFTRATCLLWNKGTTPLRDLITRYTEVLWVEAQQTAACNAAHEASERLCRWLLQSADRIGSNHVPLLRYPLLILRRC